MAETLRGSVHESPVRHCRTRKDESNSRQQLNQDLSFRDSALNGFAATDLQR